MIRFIFTNQIVQGVFLVLLGFSEVFEAATILATNQLSEVWPQLIWLAIGLFVLFLGASFLYSARKETKAANQSSR